MRATGKPLVTPSRLENGLLELKPRRCTAGRTNKRQTAFLVDVGQRVSICAKDHSLVAERQTASP
jgi:hypothetical protein